MDHKSEEGSLEALQTAPEENLQVVDGVAAGDRTQGDSSQLDTEQGEEASVEAGRRLSKAQTDDLEKSSTKKGVGSSRKSDSDVTESKDEEETEEASSVKQTEDEKDEVTATPERAGRRRSARGKKEDKTTLCSSEVAETIIKEEEASFSVLDSVEKETTVDEPAVGKRVTRGQRNKQSNKATETTRKERTPSRRRNTPGREEGTPTKKSEPAAAEEDKESLNSPLKQLVQDVRTNAGRKRGRLGKRAQTDKKASVPTKEDDKETTAKFAEGEGEVAYQILDSVEEETSDVQEQAGQPQSCNESDISASEGSSKAVTQPAKVDLEDEEEPLYEILDSVDEDQEDSMVTQGSGEITKENSDQEASVENQETSKCGVTVEEAFKAAVIPKETPRVAVDCLEKVNEDFSCTNDCGTGKKKNSPKRANTRKQNSTPQEEKLKLPKRNMSSPLNLDRVSNEEDFTTVESEEELWKKQVGPLRRQEGKAWTKEEGKGESIGRGIEVRRQAEGEEEVEEELLVILDEEGADESKEDRGTESHTNEEEMAEGEQQTLVTLDEFVEDEEDRKVGLSPLQTQPLCQQVASADPSEGRKVAEDTSATKRKHSEDTGVFIFFFSDTIKKCVAVRVTAHTTAPWLAQISIREHKCVLVLLCLHK